MKKKLLLLFVLLAFKGLAQFSKTHYIPPLIASSNVQAEQQYLYISTPSATPVNFRIIKIGGAIVNGTVSQDAPYVYEIGVGSNTQLVLDASQSNNVFANKGFIVQADDMVYVSARLIAGSGNQAGEIVSKGNAALGTRFRIGSFRNPNDGFTDNNLSFISVLATDNNTTVNFSGAASGVSFINSSSGSNPFSVTLNNGESFVAAIKGPTQGNRSALIGSLVTSDKPIAVNCGSFGGTNGSQSNLDLGFDQIVSAERTGQDYIFIRSTGMDEVETVLIIADEDGTQITRNGLPGVTTLDAGEYIFFEGNQFGPAGNMSVHANKNVFAYQSVGDNGRIDQANQELFFVPPLSCETPKVIDNIPYINQVGTRIFTGRITVVTETGSTVTFRLDGTMYSLADFGLTAVVEGPTPVIGNPGFESYVITGIDGNLSVYSTSQLYLASYGSSDAATFGGYYSGFTFKPEVVFNSIDTSQENCLPNTQLTVNAITGFDTFQWYFNGTEIPGATNISYSPTQPGYYYVKAGIAACSTELTSDNIPVSLCTADSDADGTNDNSDVDLDNDGITNCEESYGDAPFNLTNPLSGSVTAGSGAYTNSFTGSFPAGVGTPAANPFSGNANGSFVSTVSAGAGNTTVYKMSFAQPVSFALQYVQAANASDLLKPNAEFTISAPVNRTITVLNPNNQLLIDTNFDGIYESGISQFSSFEIRFRLNGQMPLFAGSGTFSFRTHLADSFTFTHRNLDDANDNRASFQIVASCVPRDSDSDGVPDALDLDSDNDSVPDFYESQGLNFHALTGSDSNSDGLDDAFPANMVVADTDGDGHPDFIDLDSDNNGVYDLVESGSGATDANNNGIVDGAAASFGANGLANNLETSANSGQIAYAMADSDADGVWDFVESDNDNDGCSDVLEAGFSDANGDGYLGGATTVAVNANGAVTGAGGYTSPNPNYITPAPITITSQPVATPAVTCELEDAVIAIDANPEATFQWQVSDDGTFYANISDGTLYTGTTTNTLTIHNIPSSMSGYTFRALLSRPGNVCGSVSESASVLVYALPPVVTRTLVQCDTGDAPDGITIFNLSEADQSFLNGDANLSVAYFIDANAAENGAAALDNDYTNLSNPQQVAAKVTNLTTGCFSVSTLNLSVNLLANVNIDFAGICDEIESEDGFTQFDLTTANLPVSGAQSVRFYNNVTDALLEQNEIQNPESYTNPDAYTSVVYARVENSAANSCSRLYVIHLEVYRLPDIDTNNDLTPHVVCENNAAFATVLDAAIQDGSSAADYDYEWFYQGAPVGNQATYTATAEGLYTVTVTNENGCSKLRYIPVVHSSQAVIQSVDVVDFVDSNTITVTLGPGSFGNYTFSLDHENAGQSGNVFTDVEPGTHTIYVMDSHGCPSAVWTDVYVTGFPKYFTPNGDGYHETWNLKGVDAARNGMSTVRIFDRYGKLLAQLDPLSDGWDGTYNGKPMPSDDYWFVIELADGRSAKGHFTLKR